MQKQLVALTAILFLTGAGCATQNNNITPPPVSSGCTSDSQCPPNYICQASQGSGTACSSNDPNCKPTFTITKGTCKSNLKSGSNCSSDQDCQAGLICHTGACANPIGRQCSGSSDTSCPSGSQCVQSCGPPVSRVGDTPPPSYCELNEYAAKPRMCPICLAGNTLIDTPSGLIPVKDLQTGMAIWTTDKSGHRIATTIIKTAKVAVPPTHQMVHLVLSNKQELLASPGHPTVNGRTVGTLKVGDSYNGATVASTELVSYSEGFTYDILPSGETGFYWANGILIGSTLH